MGIRRRGEKWLVSVELGRDEFAVRRRAFATCDTEDEAKRVYVRMQHDAYEGRHITPSEESVPAFVGRFLADHGPSIADSTLMRYEGILKTHVTPDLGRVSLAQFTPQVASKWKARQLERGLSPATVTKHLNLVGAALDLAVSWGLIARNPIRAVQFPKVDPPPFHVFTPSEQAALLSAAHASEGEGNYHSGRSEGALYLPLVLTLATGMRRGELLGLAVGDFDEAHGRLHVRRDLRKKRGGGEVMGPCKTARSRRSIVLPEVVADLLTRHLRERPKLRTDRLILSLAGTPYTLDGFEASWRHVRDRAASLMVKDAEAMHDPFAAAAGDGLRSGRWHDLRHGHATELLRAGVHVKVVAERLGDSEATVLRVYSHVLPDMQESAAVALEPMMRGLLG